MGAVVVVKCVCGWVYVSEYVYVCVCLCVVGGCGCGCQVCLWVGVGWVFDVSGHDHYTFTDPSPKASGVRLTV